MFTQLNNDQWSSLFLFILGVVICSASIHIGLGNIGNPGTDLRLAWLV